MNFWQVLEEIPGLSTLRQTWQSFHGAEFPAFRILCLDPGAKLSGLYPCPNDCGRHRDIILRHDGAGAVAVCGRRSARHSPSDGGPHKCPDVLLTIDDITPLEVNREKLGRALAKALGCDFKFFTFRSPETWQFGSLSADSVPLIFTSQFKTFPLFSTLSEISSTLRRSYCVFSPTSDFLDADCQQVLARDHAAFYALDATMALTPQGTLKSLKPPGELFARFAPSPDDPDEDLSRRLFALIQLDDDSSLNPSVLTVFRLYCIHEKSIREIAHDCKCSVGTIVNRLQIIRAKTGTPPHALRRLSIYFAKIEASLADPRARYIHRKSLAQDDE